MRGGFGDVHVVADVVTEQLVAEMLVEKTENLKRIPGAQLQAAGEDARALERGVQRVARLFDGLKERNQRLDAESRRFDGNQEVVRGGQGV